MNFFATPVSAIWIFVVFSTATSQDSVCISERHQQKAYFGWPMLVDCTELLTNCMSHHFDIQSVSCSMRSKGENETFFTSEVFDPYVTQPSLSYQIENVSANTSDIQLKVQDDSNETICCTSDIELDKQTLPNTSCQDSSGQDPAIMQNAPYFDGDQPVMHCEVLDGPEINMSQYTVTWYYNCNKALPNQVKLDSEDGAMLNFEKIDHKIHPGVYSCSIEHEGQTRFIQHNKLCVTNEQEIKSRVLVSCDSIYLIDLGSTVDVECDVEILDKDVSSNSYNMEFYPFFNGSKDFSKDPISCTDFLESDKNMTETVSPNDTRVSCSFSYTKLDPLKCFDYIPTDEEWEEDPNKTTTYLKMSYRIQGVKESDLGMFRAFAKIVGFKNTTDNSMFEIKKNSNAQNVAAIVGGVVGGVVFLIIVAAIFYLYRLEIRYKWRRSRFVPYQKDSREYGAYFFYWFERSVGGQKEISPDFIENIRKFLFGINCPVYDPARDPQIFQWSAQNIWEVQRNSDRVLILLTPQLLKEQDNDHQIIVNPDHTFVFITTPETEQTLGLISKDREISLRELLRTHSVIEWDGESKTLSQQFKMKLELAMPKRRDEQTIIYENDSVRL